MSTTGLLLLPWRNTVILPGSISALRDSWRHTGSTPRRAKTDRTRNKEIGIQIKETKTAFEKKTEELKKKIIETAATGAAKGSTGGPQKLWPQSRREAGRSAEVPGAEVCDRVESRDGGTQEGSRLRQGSRENREESQATRISNDSGAKDSCPLGSWHSFPVYILRRGNPTSFGPEVDAGPPAVLTTAALPYNVHATVAGFA